MAAFPMLENKQQLKATAKIWARWKHNHLTICIISALTCPVLCVISHSGLLFVKQIKSRYYCQYSVKIKMLMKVSVY